MAKIWTIKRDPQVTTAFETAINFTSNGESFDKIQLGHGDPPYDFYSKITYVNSNASTDKVVFNGSNKWTSYGEEYRTVTFETEPSGDLLAWLQANAVAQDQPAVTTTRVLYKGKKELTMAQFEALPSLDDAIDYDITDFPNGGITNAQMTAALGYSRLFEDGEIYVCSDNGTYTKGHTYQIKVEGGVKSWEDITSTSGDLQNYVPKQSETTNGSKTYAQVTNENGAVSIRVFENSDADLQNLSITKDGVTINGKKPLTSVQPLYKHELVIPYSFSVGDSETVNGSVIYHYLSNTETQITSASEIDDNFLLSGGIGKNSANTAAAQSESTALTWIINEKPDYQGEKNLSVTIPLTAGGNSYNGIQIEPSVKYPSPTCIIRVLNGEEIYSGAWFEPKFADRTLTFGTAPSGELLTWLQANAVPQSEVDPNTTLTWQLNDTLTLFGMETKQFNINFVSNNQSFKAIYFTLGADPYMKYLTDVDTTSGITPYSENFKWMGYDETDHSAYRTLTFETAPTGELLTWLQANAVPQGGADSNTVLLFNVNVTKAGSSITVEAVNAATTGYIAGTVGTITDTVTQLI